VPLTFPSHPAAVIPLKLWRPRWFDGVALVVGSMAPDFAYVLDGSGLPVWPFSHQLAGLVGWCLPIALVGAWAVRRAAPVIAAHLPSGGWLALRDYGSLGVSRHRRWITVSSALVGAASHLALDWFEIRVPAAELPMHVLGAVGLLFLAAYIGRRRLLHRWYGDPPARRPRPGLFWPVAAAVALPAVAITPFLPGAFLAHTTGARMLCAIAGGLLAASAVVALARTPTRAA
jgi:Domain of unknown function (DUF4184)